jgi:hypothetical protein
MAVIGAELNAMLQVVSFMLHDIHRLQQTILYILAMIMEQLGLRTLVLMVVKMYGFREPVNLSPQFQIHRQEGYRMLLIPQIMVALLPV